MVRMCLNLPTWNRKYSVPWSMKYTHRFVFWNLFEFLQLLRYKAWRWAEGSNLLSRAIFLWLKPGQRSFSVEVMGGMLPGAGGIQRIADRLGRARTIRMMMLAEPILGEQAAALGIATHVVSSGELQKATAGLALKLSTGPTRAYAAIKGLMKAWSPGVAAADWLLSDLSADRMSKQRCRRRLERGRGIGQPWASGPASPSQASEDPNTLLRGA